LRRALRNEFEVVTMKMRTRRSSRLERGVRYYDVSPWYGLGLGNDVTATSFTTRRDSYVLSSKVGKLLKAFRTTTPSRFPFSPSPTTLYSTTRPMAASFDRDSLQRMA